MSRVKSIWHITTVCPGEDGHGESLDSSSMEPLDTGVNAGMATDASSSSKASTASWHKDYLIATGIHQS
jgi:hypothetical protein